MKNYKGLLRFARNDRENLTSYNERENLTS